MPRTGFLVAAILLLALGGERLLGVLAAMQVPPAGPAQPGGNLPGDPRIQLVKVAGGFDDPVNLAFPPDDSGRIFVVERAGLIRVVDADGTVRVDPFLDLSDRISIRPGEQGLLGLAFHPDYATNGRFYVDYTDIFSNSDVYVEEFTVSRQNPNQADPASERLLLRIPKPYPAHNGGTIRFGPDGYLYVAVGDGGWQGDPFDNAQSRFTMLGKILRLDVDGGGPGQPYGIPADNPFAGPGRFDNPYPGLGREREAAAGDRQSGRDPSRLRPDTARLAPRVQAEIWALGLRNPWQISFDPATHDVYIGDVGGMAWEEINFQSAETPAGQNYGWDWIEGSHCFPTELTECPRQQVGVLPVAEYAHGDEGCAVIGLGVYRGEEHPSLDGIYFSADFCTGKVRGLQRDEAGVWQFQELLDPAMLVTGTGQDATGNIYLTARMRPDREGEPSREPQDAVWRLVAADQVPPGAETAPLGGGNEADVEIAEGDEGETTPATGDAPVAAGFGTPTATGGGTDAAGATIVSLDIAFEPDHVSVPAETEVKLFLPNRGALDHNFTVDALGISVDLPPNETGEATLNAPAGTYEYYCNVPGHKEAGMVGRLRVR